MIEIKSGLVRINETSENKIVNFHLKRGFAMLTAFRSEYTISENRGRNRKLAGDLKANGYSYIKVTGGYIETITSDNVNWKEGDVIPNDPEHRQLAVMEESFLVPMFNVETKETITDLKSFRNDMIDLGIKYEQDSVLIAPPEGQGKPEYVITNSRNGVTGSVDCTFDTLTIASVADTYFSMKEKTIRKAKRKRKDGVGGVKFESAWLDEPCHTVNGVRARKMRNELAPFGSHYFNQSSLYTRNENKMKDRNALLESLENRLSVLERKFESKYSDYSQDELDSALVSACREAKNILPIKKLLGAGSNVNADVYNGETGRNLTPLIAACYTKRGINIIKLLLENGADPKKTSEWSRLTPMGAACQLGGTNFLPVFPTLEMIDLLVSYGAKMTDDDIQDIRDLLEGAENNRIKHMPADIDDLKKILSKYER